MILPGKTLNNLLDFLRSLRPRNSIFGSGYLIIIIDLRNTIKPVCANLSHRLYITGTSVFGVLEHFNRIGLWFSHLRPGLCRATGNNSITYGTL